MDLMGKMMTNRHGFRGTIFSDKPKRGKSSGLIFPTIQWFRISFSLFFDDHKWVKPPDIHFHHFATETHFFLGAITQQHGVLLQDVVRTVDDALLTAAAVLVGVGHQDVSRAREINAGTAKQFQDVASWK